MNLISKLQLLVFTIIFKKRNANAELKRLLYVAITRAEQYLIISVGVKNDKIWPGSFASMIFDAFSFGKTDSEIEIADEITFMRYKKDQYELEKEFLHHKIGICNYIEKPNNQIELGKNIVENNYNIYCSTLYLI